jgi:hypothetical protein
MLHEATPTVERRQGPEAGTSSTVEPTVLRLSATLLFSGFLLSLLAGMLHPGQANPNDHTAAFAEYAASHLWTPVHLGQFAGMALIIAGLVVLFFALTVQTRVLMWVGRFGAVSAVVALALYGVLQAVDGIALKQAVDAWVRAPHAEQAARFASAEAIRWLEWGVRSYQSFMLGMSLVLFAIVLVRTVRIPRLLSSLMGLSGLGYIIQGVVLGAEGFSATNTAPTLVTYILWLVWNSWLLITARRLR